VDLGAGEALWTLLQEMICGPYCRRGFVGLTAGDDFLGVCD